MERFDQYNDADLPCLGEGDIFFPEPETKATVSAAKRICSKLCLKPDQLDCLADALESDANFGVWGGLSSHERRMLKRTMPEENLRLYIAELHHQADQER